MKRSSDIDVSNETQLKKKKYCFQITDGKTSNPKAVKTLWDFSQPSDLILTVEGKDLHVHKKLLIDSSPVFKEMLESDNFVEKKKNKIELRGKNFDDVQEMLNHLYPLCFTITDDTSIKNLLNLSREYQISKIKSDCENSFLHKEASVDNLIIAQEYDLQNLKAFNLKQLGKKALVDLEEDPRFGELNPANQSTLINIQLKELKSFVKDILPYGDGTDVRCESLVEIIRKRSKDFGYTCVFDTVF